MSYAVSIDLPDTGLTLTAKLISGGAVAQSLALDESVTIPGHYSKTGTGAANGKYAIRVEDSAGTLRGTGEIEIAGDVEVLTGSRLATSAYVAPDNLGIAATFTKASEAAADAAAANGKLPADTAILLPRLDMPVSQAGGGDVTIEEHDIEITD